MGCGLDGVWSQCGLWIGWDVEPVWAVDWMGCGASVGCGLDGMWSQCGLWIRWGVSLHVDAV